MGSCYLLLLMYSVKITEVQPCVPKYQAFKIRSIYRLQINR